ncbi:MAG: hypothetical protein AABX35_01865 [Nanoarchaeota archaeon]
MKTYTKILTLLIAFMLCLNLASALTVRSTSDNTFKPGQESQINVEVENNFADDVKNVVISLNFKELPLIPTRSSEKSIDQIDNDDSEPFSFLIKVSQDAKPGDYEIPYTLKYNFNNSDKTSSGTIGVRIFSQPDLTFSLSTETPVIGSKGKIELKIVNKGFSDARFLSVNAISNGFTLLSESNSYIGTVSSDDFETVSFDVIFNNQFPTFDAIVEYTDFNNQKVSKSLSIPIEVYSVEKAQQLGIIQKSNVPFYVGIVVLLIVIWIVWKAIAKRMRLRKSMQKMQEMK